MQPDHLGAKGSMFPGGSAEQVQFRSQAGPDERVVGQVDDIDLRAHHALLRELVTTLLNEGSDEMRAKCRASYADYPGLTVNIDSLVRAAELKTIPA